MLLIDGVKYQEWVPKTEDEFEQVVKEHAQDIFGEESIYFDRKQKLRSLSGIGSIPDGLVIMFGSVPQWHIVEVELSSHDPYAHIVPQIDKFINGIDNQNARNKLVDTLYNVINIDELLRRETRQAIGLDKDIHKFLADLITTPPTITIIIEKDTDQLEEALRKYAQKKIIEFQTFRRVGAESVHAHLFEPLFAPVKLPPPLPIPPEPTREGSVEIKVFKSHIDYNYFPIRKANWDLFPKDEATLELETDRGLIETEFYVSEYGHGFQKGLIKWMKAHPELKPGDRVRITVIEPMKKYRLEIEK